MIQDIECLLKAIDYDFSDAELLRCALTHRSIGKDNNERLEYLGDSILGFVIADELYHRFEDANEGQLSRLRSSLVKGDVLAELARSLDLGDYLILGSGELKSGGFRRDSILADALEALFGAIYLDSGMENAKKFIFKIFANKLNALSLTIVLKDSKTRLQEYLQSIKQSLPIYSVISIEEQGDKQIFNVECNVGVIDEKVIGRASSRRKAEQKAATKMLELLDNKHE